MNLNRARKGFAWVPGLSARSTRTAFDDGRFTAEEIVSVVRAGEAGEKLADLCQSIGITPETYYAWKARYSGLTASQVHDLRRRASVRKQRVTVLACALGVTAAGAGALMAMRPSDAPPSTQPLAPMANAAMPSTPRPPATAAQPTAAARQAPAAASTPAPAAAPAPASPAGPAPAPVAAPPAAPRPTSPDNRPASATGSTAGSTAGRPTSNDYFAPDGYSVQVSATPDLQQARAALEKLTAASHPAHITTKTIDGVEMYRVRVGPFASRDAAAQMAARLAHDGYESPWITK